jgi:hypothetical protein
MRGPIPGREFFGDQPIGGGIIGNAQQRFGNAHEGNAFLIRQAELLQEGVQERPLVAASARTLDQRHRNGHCAMPRAAREFQRMQQSSYRLIFGPRPVVSYRFA